LSYEGSKVNEIEKINLKESFTILIAPQNFIFILKVFQSIALGIERRV